MNFFLEKQLIKFSCNYWPLSFCKILKNFFGSIQSYEMCHFRAQNGPFVMEKKFVQTIIITFIYLLSLFIVQNFKKKFTVDPELWGCPIFGPKMVHLLQTNFFWKIIRIILVYLLVPFILRIRNFWAQNSPFPQMRILFRKSVNEPCFFHSCLSTYQKSKSGIDLLVKYWQLKNTEISLAESHFWV